MSRAARPAPAAQPEHHRACRPRSRPWSTRSYGDTFGTLFLIAGVVAVVTLIAVIAVNEVPLRTTIELKPQADQAGAPNR